MRYLVAAAVGSLFVLFSLAMFDETGEAMFLINAWLLGCIYIGIVIFDLSVRSGFWDKMYYRWVMIRRGRRPWRRR